MAAPTRYLSSRDRSSFVPVHAVWEITLACDLKCHHCGSRAGKRRPEELTTEEALDLVRQLARMGTREVTLIGGEAYLRRDWLKIIREVRDQGMDCTMQSGGLNLTEDRIKAAVDAGLQALGISIDGLREVHDRLRGVKGSFDAALNALQAIKKYGITSSANTQITSLVIPQLRELMNLFIDAGAKNWQVQLTVAMGRAADNPELLLQPHELLELMPLLAQLFEEAADRGFLLQPGNNIGYFGPYESVWRGSGDDRIHWTSCNAGQNTLGIEADGTIKGCPSLPTSPYAGGNIRDLSLKKIWWTTDELSINRRRTNSGLWGFCGSCYYADICKAGCTWTTHSLLGKAGNNPYCHHRALELSKQGLRERIVQVERAPGTSFDHGRFELILETMDGNAMVNNLVQITSTRTRQPTELILCRGCSRHVKTGTKVCPFCVGDIRSLTKMHEKKLREAKRAYRRLLRLLPQGR
ncbi:MAG TPA: GDL motif peptide-associated radical SAM/SPASM maturase [Pyrinomonadaceae bacterium]|jgi:Y-X(10)_GDL-associated radical SAM protein|nr:GDL motif peptide-associated radical SAM/SPASM maturase [Pyrinomonadaceae bacterium]